MRKVAVRIALSLALVATLGLSATSAFAQEAPRGPTLVVGNPSAGDMITQGAFTMEGVAFDSAATTGVGVDRVSVFLGDREAGGKFLGDATLGMPAAMPVPSGQFAQAGWTLETPALTGAGEMTELCVYARSAVTGQETVLDIPISIGQEAAPSRGGVGEEAGVIHSQPDLSGMTPSEEVATPENIN
jgi:hypothetical protein